MPSRRRSTSHTPGSTCHALQPPRPLLHKMARQPIALRATTTLCENCCASFNNVSTDPTASSSALATSEHFHRMPETSIATSTTWQAFPHSTTCRTKSCWRTSAAPRSTLTPAQQAHDPTPVPPAGSGTPALPPCCRLVSSVPPAPPPAPPPPPARPARAW